MNRAEIHFMRWLFRGYLLVLFVLPLPLGSNRPLFWAVFVTAVSLLTLAWAGSVLLGVVQWPGALRRGRWVLVFLGGFVLLAGIQAAFALWAPGSVFASVSLYDTLDALLLGTGLFLLAFLTLALVRSARRGQQVLYVLLLAGFLQAVYGSLVLLSGAEWAILEPHQMARGTAKGTFINRNHYANLLVLALSAGTGLLLAQMDLAGAATMRQRLRRLMRAALGPKARVRIFMVLIVVALVLTRSRMGNAAFFAAITLVGLFALWRLKQPSRPLLVLVVSVLIIDVFVVGTWFGVEQVIDRIQETVQYDADQWQVQERNRVNANRESLQIIWQRPVLGWGGGTFYTVYPSWRGSDQQFMDHAHNDYAQFLVEYGAIGGTILAGFLALCLLRAARGLLERKHARRFGLSFAASMAITAMSIHATVDFSLQIPANAAWFVVLSILPFTRRI